MSEETSSEWQAPPPPEKIAPVEPAEMSAVAALGNVFMEPGRVFEDMRRKPRFLVAGILSILLITLFQVVLIQKIGLETIVRARIEQSSRTAEMPKDQKEVIIAAKIKIVTLILHTRFSLFNFFSFLVRFIGILHLLPVFSLLFVITIT